MSREIVAKFSKRGAPFDGGHFISLFESPAEASRALWTSFELVHSLLCTHETQQVLVHGAHEVTSERALVLLKLLAKEPGPLRNAPTSYTTPVYGYPGWSKSLEQILRALPERTALVDGWTSLESPFGPALGLALARLGDVGGAALHPSTLQEFAVSAAKHLKWCPEVYENADVAFGSEEAWQRALALACASDSVRDITMSAAQFQRLAQYLTDDDFCNVVEKIHSLTEKETRTLAAQTAGRGPKMYAVVTERAEAILKGGVEGYRTSSFTLTAYVYCLRDRRESIPESLLDVTRQLLDRPFHPSWMWDVVGALSTSERDVLLLPWLRSNPDLRGFPTELSTPAIAEWAVATLLQNEDSWLETHLPEFGPWVVTHLAQTKNLRDRSATIQSAVARVASHYPSSESAALLAELLQHSSDERIAARAAEGIMVQPVDILVATVRATFAGLPTGRQQQVATALTSRAFDPEVRSLASELGTQSDNNSLADTLAFALDQRCPLPLAITNFVEQVRALPADLHEAAERHLADLRARKTLRASEANEVKSDEARATLYRIVCAAGDASIWADLLAQRGEGDAVLFYMLHAWPRGADVWRVMRSTEIRVLPALAMIFTDAIRWNRLTAQAQQQLLMHFANLDPSQLLRLIDETQFLPTKDHYEHLLKAMAHGLTKSSDAVERRQVVSLLRHMLADKLRRAVALTALGQHAAPELRSELEGLKAAKLAKSETKLLEQALLLTKAGDRPNEEVAEKLALVPIGQMGSGPIVRIEVSEKAVAASSTRTLTVFTRDGHPLIQIEDISADWRVSPDASYVVSLSEDGVALFDQQGKQFSPENDADEGGLLYPNDGISGALPLSSTRFLVWAVGHNVYEALTLYEPTTGKELASRKARSQITDIAVLPDAQHFIVLSDDGSLELRDCDSAKRDKALGRAEDLGHGWTQLRIINGGKRLLVWDEHCAQVLVGSTAEKFRKTSTTRDGGGTLVSHPLASQFVVIVEKRVDVYHASGKLLEVFELAGTPQHCAMTSDGKLAVTVSAELKLYDLVTNQLAYTASCEHSITALCGGHRELAIGLGNGQILRASWSS